MNKSDNLQSSGKQPKQIRTSGKPKSPGKPPLHAVVNNSDKNENLGNIPNQIVEKLSEKTSNISHSSYSDKSKSTFRRKRYKLNHSRIYFTLLLRTDVLA